MQVLLRSDVEGLGKKGDIVDVAAGHARNYLVPKGLAIKAVGATENQAEAMRRARDIRDAAERAAAEEIATGLVAKVVTIAARAADEGRLFGSVTTADVAAAVQEQTGVELDRHQLRLDAPIKELGTHSVQAQLHSDVVFAVTVEVVSE